MTPYHWHATAAAWSLQAARTTLAEHAAAEQRPADTTPLAAAPILRSPAVGSRWSSGGHGDPTTVLALAAEPRITTWTELLHRLDSRLDWLADHLRAGAPHDPLERIRICLPQLLPGTARIVARHLDDEDAWVRDAIRQPRPAEPLPGVACPHCGERRLVVQTAGPVAAWTVVCATGRLCVGPGCPCGMPNAVEGAPHIWPRAQVLGPARGRAA